MTKQENQLNGKASEMKPSKTKTSFYRRIYTAYLISKGVNTVPKLMEATGMPRRTAQDTIVALADIDIVCEFQGANKGGAYCVKSWGAINHKWLNAHHEQLAHTLGYSD